MIKTIALILILALFIKCNNTHDELKLPSDSENNFFLSQAILKNYKKVYNREGVIGISGFDLCDDKEWAPYEFIRDNATKDELLFMLSDTCSPGFKVFLMQEIHFKYPENDNIIKSKFKDDTTTVVHNSSCVGIIFTRTLAEESELVITDYTESGI